MQIATTEVHRNATVAEDLCRGLREEAQLGDYGGVLRLRARLQPDRVAYISLSSGDEETARYTYSEFDHEVRRLAAALQAAGATGGRVLIIQSSDLHYTLAFWACLYAGATAVTTIVPSSREQMRRLGLVAADAGARHVLCQQSVRTRLEGTLELPEGTAWVAMDELPEVEAHDWRHSPVDWESVAVLQYTSGSTSDPRGVMVTHRNLLRIGAYQERLFSLTPDDRAVVWLPQSHDFGLMLGVLQPVYSGYEAVVMNPMAFLKRPLRWLAATHDYRATVWLAPNFAYDLCVDAVKDSGTNGIDLSSLSLVVNGAEPIRKSTYENFIATFQPVGFDPVAFSNAYGLAETTLAVTCSPRDELYRCAHLSRHALGSGKAVAARPGESAFDVMDCGAPLPGLDIRVVDPVRSLPLGADEVGEIWVAGPLVTRGYWGKPTDTEQVFGARLADGTGPFLRTGDLGYRCGSGNLHITGRCKDVIIVHGKNHAPQDIELTVEGSHLAIRPHCGAAFSVDHGGREVAVVAVELRRECLPGLDLDEVGRTILRRVALEHQVPLGEVVFLARGGCPKTTSGKVQRRRVRQMYLDGALESVGRHVGPTFGGQAPA